MKLEISKLKPNKDNPRIIKDSKFKKLVQSIKDFPQMLELRPIVVDEDMTILGGNMRYKASVEAGLKEVYIKIAEGLTEDQKKEFIIKDNVGFGEWEWDILANEWDSVKLNEWGLDVWQNEDDLIKDEQDYKEEIPKEVYLKAWRQYAKEISEQYEILSKNDYTFSGISIGAAKIQFLKSLYKGDDYPRYCSLAFHTHQFNTNGDLYSVNEGLKKVADNKIKAERLIFCLNDTPKLNSLTSGSLPFAGSRMPLDFPVSLARELINRYSNNGSVLDPCFGWGGRLTGFLLSNAVKYVGVDASDLQHKGVTKIKNAFSPLTKIKKDTKLICSKFEDFETKEKFDLAITSPPYFDVEKYDGGEQSHILYNNYDIWKQNFYEVLISKVYTMLKDNAYFLLQVGSQRYPLIKDGIKIAEKIGFTIVDNQSANMDNNFKKTSDENKERILILKKQ